MSERAHQSHMGVTSLFSADPASPKIGCAAADAKRMPGAGVVFRLEVDLGRCYQLKKADPHMTDWHTKLGYDSCWSPAGANGIREENCIADPTTRVRIVEVILGDTRQAQAMGFSVDSQTCRLKLDPQRAAAAQASGNTNPYMTPQQVKVAQRKSILTTALGMVLLYVFVELLTDSEEGFWPCAQRPSVSDRVMIHDDAGSCAESRFGQIGQLVADSYAGCLAEGDSCGTTCAEMCDANGCGSDCYLCAGTGGGQPGSGCAGCSRARQPGAFNTFRCIGRDDQTLQVRFDDGETCSFSTTDVYCYGERNQ